MRKLLGLLLVSVVAMTALACSTSNVGDTLAPDFEEREAAFAVDSEATGLGTYNPVLAVERSTDGTVVTVNTQSAQDLSAVAFNLRYDTSVYTPKKVEFSDFLGTEDQILTFTLTNQPGIVPVGIVQVSNRGAAPVQGEGVLAKIHFSNTPFVGKRGVSSSPKGDANRVDDLELVSTGSGDMLTWTEKNAGDYNIDGVVSAQDLTPIGVNFGQQVATSSNPQILRIIDGSGDGTINVQDLTTIGLNFGNKITGYMLFVDDANSPEGGDIWAPRSEQTREQDQPMVYEVEIDLSEFPGAQLSVAPAANDDMSNPGPKSNKAESIIFDPGAPNAPSTLSAEGGESVGDRRVNLSWTKSGNNDIKHYVIEWKPSSSDDSAYQVYGTTLGDVDTATVNNPAFTEQSYDFRIKAIDREAAANESGYSNVASATPYIAPVILPDAPANVVANPGSSALSILVDWDATTDGMANKYRVYRKGPGDSNFTMIHETINSAITERLDIDGLAEGQTYEYYVTAFNTAGVLESLPSTTVSAQPSAAVQFEVTGLTTDKTTHHVDGSEAAANLALACSITPDSVNWSSDPAGVGTFTGTGANVTWKPSGSPTPQKVTITGQATLGAQNDSASVTLYLTNETIKTSFADRGGGGNNPVGSPPNSGIMPEFELGDQDYLEPLSQGGEITSLDQSFKEFSNGAVVMAKRWALW